MQKVSRFDLVRHLLFFSPLDGVHQSCVFVYASKAVGALFHLLPILTCYTRSHENTCWSAFSFVGRGYFVGRGVYGWTFFR